MIRIYGYPLVGPTITINRVGDSIRLFWHSAQADSYKVYASPTIGGALSLIGTTADTVFTVSTVDTSSVRRLYEVRSVFE
jgi:hypothetical protein